MIIAGISVFHTIANVESFSLPVTASNFVGHRK